MGTNHNVINEAELRELSPAQRGQVAHMLAAIDYPHPVHGLNVNLVNRNRRFAVLFSVAACAVLLAWIFVLAFTLDKSSTAPYWRVAWVGFDVAELAAFAATGWAFWRGRQIVISFLIITGTLLCCDAWFDVILDLGTGGIWGSVAEAIFVELPIAFLMFNAARRLIRLSTLVALAEAGEPEEVPPLWRIPLFAGLLPSRR